MWDKLFQKNRKKKKKEKKLTLMRSVWPWFQNQVRTVQENIEFMNMNFITLNVIFDNQI